MYIIFLIIALLVFVSLHLYLFIRGWQALPEKWFLRALYLVVFLVLVFSIIIGIFIRENLLSKTGIAFRLIGTSWIVFFAFLLLATLLADLLRVLNYFFKIFPKWVTTHYSKVKLLYFASILLSMFIISLYGFKWLNNTQTVELNLSINKDNCQFKNLNIVAASDFHLGTFIHKEMLTDWISTINNKDPDIILLVGDIFDRSFNFDESQDIIKELKKLKSRYGVYTVLGNHEYYEGVKKAINCIEQSGIKLLRDQSITIDNRFAIIGRDDATNTERKTLDSLVYGLDPGLPTILLDHQPYLNEAVKNKIDLQISGHLHNGQICPFNFIISKFWALSYGYRKIGDTNFYVSSGLGVSYVPMRLGTQSEIVQILLKAKSDTSTDSR
jgi:predicted MPP superfamily phosphohydrolase